MSFTKIAGSMLNPEAVQSFYLERLSRFPLEVQFQFATFLYLWNGNQQALQHLRRVQPILTFQGDITLMFQKLIKLTDTATHYDKTAAGTLLAPYFKRYPNIYTHTYLLLYLMYLETVYGIDGRPQLLSLVSLDEFLQTKTAIEGDDPALAVLSSVAINNLYGYNYLLREREPVNARGFLDAVLPQYDLDDRMHVRFLAYVYIHIVINESAFFANSIAPGRVADLMAVVKDMETLIADHYFDISLDIKCGFLACSNFLGYQSGYRKIINEEVSSSKHPRGMFAYDRLNLNPSPKEPTIPNMAHTMAFYIIGNSAWQAIPR